MDECVVAESDDGRVHALAGYPGANAAAVRFDGDRLRLAQDVRDSGSEWTFYWNVGVESDADLELTVVLDDELVGRFGPVVSHDRRSWDWLGHEHTPDRRTFTYRFEAGERAYFAFSFPYLLADLEAFWDEVGDHPGATRERLTISPDGRAVPLLRLGDHDAVDNADAADVATLADTAAIDVAAAAADEHVVLAARHHACESPASYALEGTVRALLSRSADLAGRCVHVVPIVDVDGVQRGDQGKYRVPHDHNRDYAAGNAILDDVRPIYPETAAIQELVSGLDGDLALALDLHSPWKWGDPYDEPFFAGDPDAVGPADHRLAALIDAETGAGDEVVAGVDDDVVAGAGDAGAAGANDPLDFDSDPAFAEPGGFAAGSSFAAFCERAGAPVARSLEVPYIGTDAHPVTPTPCRGLGRALGRAIVRFLGE